MPNKSNYFNDLGKPMGFPINTEFGDLCEQLEKLNEQLPPFGIDSLDAFRNLTGA